MKELAIRLQRGSDLKKSIEEICKDINTAVVLSGVGCVYELHLRMAGAKDYLQSCADYEIVSLTGTVSNGKAHIHMSAADVNGHCFGGHLEYGCLIDTTCELVLGILEEYESYREYDENVGFKEIVFKRK